MHSNLSMTCFRMENCSSTTMSAVDAVLQSEDLLTEIMVRSPLKEVHKFRCVCRAWNNIISHPDFPKRYISERKKSLRPLLGFFHAPLRYKVNIPEKYRGPGISFSSTSKGGGGPGMVKSQDRLVKKLGFFMCSSPEGLVLCGRRPSTFCVWNPLKNHCVSLPRPRIRGDSISIGFACDEFEDNGVMNFKVVRSIVNLSQLVDNKMLIETFCSRTGKWCESQLSSPINFRLFLCTMCEVVDRVFYWEAEEDYVAAHDPRTSNDHVWLIRLPGNNLDSWMRKFFNIKMRRLGQSSNGRLKCALGNGSSFQIWILKKRLSEYSFAHPIEMSEWVLTDTMVCSMPINCPSSLNSVQIRFGRIFHFISAFHPQDSRLLYLHSGENIYACNLETRTLEFVECDGVHLRPKFYDIVPYVEPAWLPNLPIVKNH